VPLAGIAIDDLAQHLRLALGAIKEHLFERRTVAVQLAVLLELDVGNLLRAVRTLVDERLDLLIDTINAGAQLQQCAGEIIFGHQPLRFAKSFMKSTSASTASSPTAL